MMDELLVPRHPDQSCHQRQAAMLAAQPNQAERARLAQLLRFGNANHRYYHEHEVEATEADYLEWLGGLPEPGRATLQALGFAELRDSLPLRRYVLEKNDIGLSDFLRGVLSPTDWQAFQDTAPGILQPWLPPLTGRG